MSSLNSNIRAATMDDMVHCLDISPNYLTSHVWQIEINGDKRHKMVQLRTVRLPRPAEIIPTDTAEERWQAWCTAHDFFVIEADEKLCGYLAVKEDVVQKTAVITDLTIQPQIRRRGLATALLRQASAWAQGKGFSHLSVALPTKNYPAIQLCQKAGFLFCGFNENLYQQRDITLFFSAKL